MKEKTSRQVEAIQHEYNFGVEVEMTGITRKDAAILAGKYFGTNSHRNTAARNGYMAWSAWDAEGREWKFQRDSSLKGPDDEKCELVTPILEYSDIFLLMGLLDRLKMAGAISNPSVMAGVHIHVSRKGGFNVQEVKNLVNVMAAHESQLIKAIGIDQDRIDRYCRTVEPTFLEMMHKRNPKTMEALERCWYVGNGADSFRSHHYNHSRYHMTNLHSLFNGHGTIEFRLFQFSNPKDGNPGGINTDEMLAYIQLCLAMCALAHEIRSASAIPQQTENEKYAMRCWLLRLGFIGEEFATGREVLLRNMDGNCAWRFA